VVGLLIVNVLLRDTRTKLAKFSCVGERARNALCGVNHDARVQKSRFGERRCYVRDDLFISEWDQTLHFPSPPEPYALPPRLKGKD
jgi:hypothetical protein